MHKRLLYRRVVFCLFFIWIGLEDWPAHLDVSLVEQLNCRLDWVFFRHVNLNPLIILVDLDSSLVETYSTHKLLDVLICTTLGRVLMLCAAIAYGRTKILAIYSKSSPVFALQALKLLHVPISASNRLEVMAVV